jgi:hypothetical protein
MCGRHHAARRILGELLIRKTLVKPLRRLCENFLNKFIYLKIFLRQALIRIQFASRIRVALRFLDTNSFDRRGLSG